MIKQSKNNLRLKRKRRVRAKVFGAKKRPRLCVFKSLRDICAQVINDESGKTLVAASLKDIPKKIKNNLMGAEKVGEVIAEKCSAAKITEVVFDRNGYKYHGKIKSVAEGARKGGLKI